MRGYWRCTVGLLALTAFGAASPSHAQDVAGKTADAPQAKDIVRLKNGGLLRGTISELVPGDSVTIITASGKTREFKMAEVDYAGPADRDPQATAKPAAPPATAPAAETTDAADASKTEPLVTVSGQRADLQLTSEPEGVTFHRQSGSAVAVGARGAAVAIAFDRLCTAPCKVSLPAGTETFALSRAGEFPIFAEPVTVPAGPSQVVGSFKSRSGVRVAGWVIAVGSVVGGGVLIYSSFGTKRECSSGPSSCYDSLDLNLGTFLAGTGLLGLGTAVGLVMAVTRDVAQVDVKPGQAALFPKAPGLLLSGRL
jgi:hypothetical protein